MGHSSIPQAKKLIAKSLHRHLPTIRIWVAILSFYFLLRLLFIQRLPVYNDETIYIHWAQLILKDSQNLMWPVILGRQPLFIWFMTPFVWLFSDPFLAGRLSSLFAGLITLIGLYFLSKEIFQKKIVGYLACIVYILYPFAHFYDRIALLDGLVGMFTIWSLYFSVLLVRYVRLDTAYTLGFLLGGGLLTKSNAVFSVYLLPLIFLMFDFKNKYRVQRFGKLIALLSLAIAIAYILHSIILLHPGYRKILDVNGLFIYPKREFITFPIAFMIENFLRNILLFGSYLFWYMTPVYAGLIIFSLLLYKQFFREKIFLILYFVLPLCAFALFGRSLLPRYIYVMTLSLLPVVGYSIYIFTTTLQKKFASVKKRPYLIYVMLFLYPALVCIQLTYGMQSAFIPRDEKVTYQTSGLDFLNKTIDWIEKDAKSGKVFVGVEGYIGWAPHYYEIYFNNSENVSVKGYWPMIEKIPQNLQDRAKVMPTYLVISRFAENDLPKNLPIELVFEKKVILEVGKQHKPYFFRFYKVLPTD